MEILLLLHQNSTFCLDKCVGYFYICSHEMTIFSFEFIQIYVYNISPPEQFVG